MLDYLIIVSSVQQHNKQQAAVSKLKERMMVLEVLMMGKNCKDEVEFFMHVCVHCDMWSTILNFLMHFLGATSSPLSNFMKIYSCTYVDIMVGLTLVFSKFCYTSRFKKRTMTSMKAIYYCIFGKQSESTAEYRAVDNEKAPIESRAIPIQNCIVYGG